ncbi:MAG TPA: DUF2804 family protein [Solirubrobacteraceae bacterium]|nr:DUF2804 family protein [Solirubrobacteraceae bacterium]
MACAALVHVGPARQSFWALHRRDGGGMRERTRLLPRARELRLETGTLLLRDCGVELKLELSEDAGFEAFCPNGRQYVWTRKQAGVLARGTLAIDGGPAQPIEARAVIDDTAGYHSRDTEWWWSAGVGSSPDGVALAWNLVSGVNDPERGSERAVWVDGAPHEVEPVRFDGDLRRVDPADGSPLLFHAEAERSHSENLLVFKSDYRAPFGTFSGALPGGIALAQGLGVMEHHRARW